MIDEPDHRTLLEAMATTLSDQVVPSCTGGAQHAARVVANLCRIMARDTQVDGDTALALADLVDHDGAYAELVDDLDQMIVRGERLGEILPLLLADATRRAEIAKPGYTDHGPA